MAHTFLSIHENTHEVKEFMYGYGFITEEEFLDDEYDLFESYYEHLEGDIDFLEYHDDRGVVKVFFGEYHPDYTYNGKSVVITDADTDLKLVNDMLESFFDRKEEWECVSPAVIKYTKKPFVYYKGENGYVYTVYVKK